MNLNTAFLLMTQYNGAAVIPLPHVCRDYFSHLTEQQFVRKATAEKIRLAVVPMEVSQKAARGIHLQDLADYLDARREAAQKEPAQMHGAD
jgi:hypothetical protein